MTRNFFISIFFLVTGILVSETLLAGSRSESSKTVSHHNKTVTIPVDGAIPGTSLPVTHEQESEKKSHMTRTEELAHIHHFHKERVKKLKRHHKKCWILSKILLVLCHLLILVCAYIHLTH